MAQFPSLTPRMTPDSSSQWGQSRNPLSDAKQDMDLEQESSPVAATSTPNGQNHLKRSSSDPLPDIAAVAEKALHGKESKHDEKEDPHSKSTPAPSRPREDSHGIPHAVSELERKVKTVEFTPSAFSAPSIVLPSSKDDSGDSDVSSKAGSSPREKKQRRDSLPKRKASTPIIPSLNSASSMILPPTKKEDLSDSEGSVRSERSDSRGSTPRKVKQERRKSGSISTFMQMLGSSNAHRTVAVAPQASKSKLARDVKKLDASESKPVESKKSNGSSSKFLENLNQSRAAHQTVAVGIRDADIGRKKPSCAINMMHCQLTTVPPLFFLEFSSNFEEKVNDIEAIESKIADQQALVAIAENNLKACKGLALTGSKTETDYFSDKIAALKIVKKGLSGKPKDLQRDLRKALDHITEDVKLVKVAMGCKETKERNLKVDRLDEIQKIEVVSEMVEKLSDAQHESSKFLHKRLESLPLDTVLVLLEDHVNSLESMTRAITAQYAGLKEEANKILTDEIEFLEIIVNCDDLPDVQRSITAQIRYYNATILEQRRKLRGIQEWFRKHWCTDIIKRKAEEHLVAGTLPSLRSFASTREKIKKDCIFAEMANLAIEKSQLVRKIKAGSGDVRIITYNGATKFVIKPLEGAPGKPGNEKDQTPNKLRVVGDRSLVSNRMGFPVSEGFAREMGQYTLFNEENADVKPRRTIACLPLSPERPDLVPCLVMEYVEHDFVLDDLANVVRRECYEKDKSLSDDDRQRLCSDLPKLEHKTATQEELIRLCSTWKTVDRNMNKLALLPLWDFASQESLVYLFDHTFRLGDCDRNPQNILLKLRVSANGARPIVDLIPIDFDQILPDSWPDVNMPAFVHTKAADVVISTLEKLKKAIIAYNADEILNKLKKDGYHFQEHRRAFPMGSTDVIAGGETYNFLRAVHTVAKLGLANGNTVSHIAEIAFTSGKNGTSFIHDAFLKAKKLVEENKLESSPEYVDLCKTTLYQECFAKESANDFKLWKNFENMILTALNKKKHPVSQQVTKK